MATPLDILRRHWGYSEFRPLQSEIIESVLSGSDTLGLLPTGGGKSITFQVPALMLPGVTLVVTPLISLMKDQVDNLLDRDIRAACIHSGLTRREQRLAIDKARLGRIKLLYLSPEKLQSRTFLDELRYIDVSLLVVDEAHCISQWGYDFRPSYLKIAEVRGLFPDAPVLALTASATEEVSDDIMRSLRFRNPKKFARSFSRPNLCYLVRRTELKEEMCLKVLGATTGSAIVYVRSRKHSRTLADYLQKNGISAHFYHAGLSVEEKNERQNAWREDRIRVMVATNAFGMGIDKPDVRVVIHADPPSSLEEYYQEAGRAGRDGKPAFAVMIASTADKGVLTRRLNESFPDKDFIRRVYELAFNFLNVAVGEGYNSVFDFNFPLFCTRFGLKPAAARNALLILTRAGYMEYVDEVAQQSRLIMLVEKRELYDLDLDPLTDSVLVNVLRSYSGMFADYVVIRESLIASNLGITEQQVYETLLKLSRLHAIHYVPRKVSPYIYITTSRELPKHVMLPRNVYEDMRERMERRIESVKRFMFDDSECRVAGMLRYFGEKDASDCGQCDVCRSRRKSAPRPGLQEEILRHARQGNATVQSLAYNFSMSVDSLVPVLRDMADKGQITVTDALEVRIPD